MHSDGQFTQKPGFAWSENLQQWKRVYEKKPAGVLTHFQSLLHD